MNQRNKPDLLWVLVFIFGLGVVTTGYAQGIWERKLDNAYQMPVDASQPRPTKCSASARRQTNF